MLLLYYCVYIILTRSAPLATQAPSSAADDDQDEPRGDRRLLEARLAESHQGWTLRRLVIEILVSCFLEDGVDPFDQWPSQDQRPLWEAAFEDAVEGHSKSAKLEFIEWLQARGTLQANIHGGGVTTCVTPVETPPSRAEEVGGDGALELAPAAEEGAAPKSVIVPAAVGETLPLSYMLERGIDAAGRAGGRTRAGVISKDCPLPAGSFLYCARVGGGARSSSGTKRADDQWGPWLSRTLEECDGGKLPLCERGLAPGQKSRASTTIAAFGSKSSHSGKAGGGTRSTDDGPLPREADACSPPDSTLCRCCAHHVQHHLWRRC